MATTWAGTATNQGITRTAMNDLWNTYTNGNYPWCDGCTLPANSLQLITKDYFTTNYYKGSPGNYLINTSKTGSQILVKSDIGIVINLYTIAPSPVFVATVYLNSTLTLAYTNAAQTTLYNGGGTQRYTDSLLDYCPYAEITISSAGVVSGINLTYC
jgi:hypothetical protein